MKTRINMRNLIIIILCITIICMGISFAYLSVKLEKKNQQKEIFDVSFTKISNKSHVKGGQIAPSGTHSITDQGKTLNMHLILNMPHDELAYTVIIKNEGTIPAEIVSIKEFPDFTNNISAEQSILPLSISHNDVIGEVLQPQEEIELTITAIYNPTTSITSKTIDYQLSVIATTPKED